MNKILQVVVLAAATTIPFGALARAGEVSIELLNKSGERRFAFSPDIVRIEPGDTVIFVPVDKGHNAVSIDGMLPDGATKIAIGFNKGDAVRFEEPGIYGIKCTPHVGLGMVSLIVVGEAANGNAVRQALRKLPPKARDRMAILLSHAAG